MSKLRDSILIGVFVALALATLHALAAGGPGVSGPQHNVGSTAITGGTSNRLLRNNAGVLANSLLSDDGTNVTLTSGQHLGPDGSATLPTYSFSSDPDNGIYWTSANGMGFANNNTARMALISGQLRFDSGQTIGWSATGATGTLDVALTRDAANVLRLADGDYFMMGSTSCVATDCDAAAEEGRLCMDTTAGIMKVCDQTGTSTGWAVVLDFSS